MTLSKVMAFIFLISPALAPQAKDNMTIGYTSTGGIFTGLFDRFQTPMEPLHITKNDRRT